jgi:MFS family permease
MATATVVARLGLGIPLGRLADRIGRKRVIYLLTPLWYVSNLLLAFSTGSITLILYAAFQTFYTISSGVTTAMTLELVPVEQQGRWSGLLGLFTGLVTIPAPLIGGLIWRELGPMYVFLIPIALDLLLRVPLFSTVSDTLRGPSPAEMRAG